MMRPNATHVSLSFLLFTIIVTIIAPSSQNFAQNNCAHEVRGTTSPNTSGSPAVINSVTGTVISANFFNSGAIDPQDGLEFVSVCVQDTAQNGIAEAVITTDIGLDDDFIIKAYPQFVVGSKFGNIFETSFRFYNNTNLPPENQWPVRSTNLDQNGDLYEFANLEYVSTVRGIGLPAFTNALPEISVVLDIDEQNVVGVERDIMLESWFYDTSAHSAIIGDNAVTNQPLAGSLNNIVGVGHRHFPELNNTLLEMMVHVGALSPNDISGASNNPAQLQLSETYSGKDADGDGIDDHFDVDSHVYLNSFNPLDPSPGLYSSGLDANNDGIDDADILPVVIGDHAYSIWYGATFLSPLVVYSRETDSNLVPAMDLSSEGEIHLPWNDFLNYTLNDLEGLFAQAGVSLSPEFANAFPAMSAPTGAIGGIELGVEPQINNPDDDPYVVTFNKFDLIVNGKSLGLVDRINPTGEATNPADGSTITQNSSFTIAGNASDESGIQSVILRVERIDVSPIQFWNGTIWQTDSIFLDASSIDSNGNWTLEDVDLMEPGDYRVRLGITDTVGNTAASNQNPRTNFEVISSDNTDPTGEATNPADDSTITPEDNFTISGEAIDPSGIASVIIRVERRDVSPIEYWNGTTWQTESVFLDATNIDPDGDWDLEGVDLGEPGSYRVRLNITDNIGNTASSNQNPRTDFEVASDETTESDTTDPTGEATNPADDSTITPDDNFTISGEAIDSSGIASVIIRIERRDVSPIEYWNGTSWQTESIFLDASNIDTNGNWDLEGVDLGVPGSYRVRMNISDTVGNTATSNQNPRTDFEVASVDTTDPTGEATNPADDSTITPDDNFIISGEAIDSSGIASVILRVERRDVSPIEYWNGTTWQTDSIFLDATNIDTNGDWDLEGVDLGVPGSYRVRLNISDNVGNTATSNQNPRTDFFVE